MKRSALPWISPAASRRPPQAGWGPRTDTPNSAHPSGNSFRQNLARSCWEIGGKHFSLYGIELWGTQAQHYNRGTSLTDAGFEELAAYPLVHADSFGYLLYIGSSGLAQSTDAVDAADSLCQESVGCLHTQGTLVLLACAYYREKKIRQWKTLLHTHSPVLIAQMTMCWWWWCVPLGPIFHRRHTALWLPSGLQPSRLHQSGLGLVPSDFALLFPRRETLGWTAPAEVDNNRNLEKNRLLWLYRNDCIYSITHTWRLRLGLVLASNIRLMLSAALTGTVLFSVTIL